MAVLGADLTSAFALLDPAHLAETMPRFKLAVAALVRQYGQASVTLAGRYYRDQRAAAGISSGLTMWPAEPAPLQQVSISLDWAVKDVWAQPEQAWPAAQVKVTGVAEKLALDQGRWTAIDSVAGDREAIGWARVPEPGCCAFCALLATRGAVYKSGHSAGTNMRGPRNPNAGKPFLGEGKAKFHDHCRCIVTPAFHAYEPSAQVREWDALYARSTAGLSGRAARTAFRQAFEGQQVT